MQDMGSLFTRCFERAKPLAWFTKLVPFDQKLRWRCRAISDSAWPSWFSSNRQSAQDAHELVFFIDKHRNKMRIIWRLDAVLWYSSIIYQTLQSSSTDCVKVLRAPTTLEICKSACFFRTTFYRAYSNHREKSIHSYCMKIYVAVHNYTCQHLREFQSDWT